MLAETAFSFANATTNQTIAFVAGAIVHTLFFVWVAYLVRMK